MTLETKPQRRDQHTVLCHMAGLQPGGHMVSAAGGAGPQGPCPVNVGAVGSWVGGAEMFSIIHSLTGSLIDELIHWTHF